MSTEASRADRYAVKHAPSLLDRIVRKTSPQFVVSLETLKATTEIVEALTEILTRLEALNERLDRWEI